KVALEAIDSGWEIATLARAIGVYHRAVQKWIEAYHANGNGVVNVRGRRSELERAEYSEHAMVLRRLASDSATSHLSARAIWELYLKHFECSVECQASGECPHRTVSYQVALRFLQSLPSSFGEQKTRFSKRFRSAHSAIVPPSVIWLFDRSKSDLFLVANEMTGEVKRFEIAAGIDRGTMTCLALAAVERSDVEPKNFNPYFDAVAFNVLFADALCGTLTGVCAKPKVMVIDWGKVENNNALLDVCKRLRIDVQRARPYDPGSKPEVEAFFAFVHQQLEAKCPGYVGSNNQRPETRPLCTESGKGHRRIDMETGEVYWVDDSGRRLLTVTQFNELLREFARRWNAQISPKWQEIRLQVFQRNAIRHEVDEELLRIKLIPAITRKIRTDGEIFWREHRFWHPVTAIYAGFGDYRQIKARIAPDHRCWLFTVNDELLCDSLKESEAVEVPIWRFADGSVMMECWTEFKRAMVRRIKRIVDESLKLGRSVNETVMIYKDELMAEFEKFLANPRSFLPYKPPQSLEDEPARLSLEEEMELLHEIGNYLEQETKAMRERLRQQRFQPKVVGWIWDEINEEEANDNAPCIGSTSNL
ncbi:MAG: hypothetical protein RMK89_11695, partial [Armatimonadota bacterium]|nr:hypothetical protein [Armatimonadota bacterium]MDW8144111.1 hypothetical protein [Armatimonadota bacterium]